MPRSGVTVSDAEALADVLAGRDEGLFEACELAAAYREVWLARRQVESSGGERLLPAEERMERAVKAVLALEHTLGISWRRDWKRP